MTGYSYVVSPCDNGPCDEQDEDGLAAALAKFGPISVCINADGWWDGYKGGVLSTPCSSDALEINHCVQLVGYDKSAPIPYWKVRNEWTTNWGEAGFRLPMGHTACGNPSESLRVLECP